MRMMPSEPAWSLILPHREGQLAYQSIGSFGPICARSRTHVSAARIDTISGLDSLKDLPGVDSITINHRDGETVDYRRGRRDFLFQVYGAAGDYDKLESQLALVDQAVSVTYANERGLPNGDA